ncbi:MAG: hypothetical protein ACKV22_23190 [Bryobacteraceae bacterium]
MAIQYENAPITEALIDIRVELPSGVTLETLEGIHREVKDRYPGKKKRVYMQGHWRRCKTDCDGICSYDRKRQGDLPGEA